MGGFDQRIEVIVKMQKRRGRGGCDARIEAIVGGGSVCEPRIQVILKIQKIVRVRSGGEWGLGGLM